MLKIRLARIGRRNRPYFRVVVTEHTAPAKSGYLEVIGHYDPLKKKLEIDKEAIKEWQKKGAQLSTTVNNLLVKEKIIKGPKIKVSREKKKEEKKKEPKAKKKPETKREAKAEVKPKEKKEEKPKAKKAEKRKKKPKGKKKA